MKNSLIPGIEKAIKSYKTILAGLTAEKANIMPQLKKAHYINTDIVHLIERQYCDKISSRQQELADMEAHLKELKSNG